MLDFLFDGVPTLCCRCGEKFRESQKLKRVSIDDDNIYCEECVPLSFFSTSEIDYVFLDGEPKVFLDSLDSLQFDNGLYEIEFAGARPAVYRVRNRRKNTYEFIKECKPFNYVVEITDEEIVVCFPRGEHTFADRDEGIFYECSRLEKYFGKCKFISLGFPKKDINPEYYKGECLDYRLDRAVQEIVTTKKLKSSQKKTFSREKEQETAKKASAFLDFCQKRIIGQDSELKKAAFMIMEYVRKVQAGEKFDVQNWLLTAPSGSGKTEFFRCVRDYFALKKIDIPVIIYDLSQLTPSGYKGKNAADILVKITESSPDGTCICFLDEADKKFYPDTNGGDSDFNLAAQDGILALIEGKEEAVGKKKIDTSKTMFVFLGAFQYIRDDKIRKNGKAEIRGIGFNVTEKTSTKNTTETLYEPLTIDDLIKYGLTEQLAGRISRVVNFRQIKSEEMRKLIKCKVTEISRKEKIKISITEKAVDEFMNIAYTNMGIRAIINRINELVYDAITESYFSVPVDKESSVIIISSVNEAKLAM